MAGVLCLWLPEFGPSNNDVYSDNLLNIIMSSVTNVLLRIIKLIELSIAPELIMSVGLTHQEYRDFLVFF